MRNMISYDVIKNRASQRQVGVESHTACHGSAGSERGRWAHYALKSGPLLYTYGKAT